MTDEEERELATEARRASQQETPRSGCLRSMPCINRPRGRTLLRLQRFEETQAAICATAIAFIEDQITPGYYRLASVIPGAPVQFARKPRGTISTGL